MIDLVGERFGRLTVDAFAESRGGKRYWLCRCDCGVQVVRSTQVLREGRRKSCGCLRTQVRTGRAIATEPVADREARRKTFRAYGSWQEMMIRCFQPSCRSYKYYGGRGITVCERWMAFENFLADMGERPRGMTINRINNDGNYEPGNCCWATQKEQNRNHRGCMLTPDDVRDILVRIDRGERPPSIARDYPVDVRQILRIGHGQTWSDVVAEYRAAR